MCARVAALNSTDCPLLMLHGSNPKLSMILIILPLAQHATISKDDAKQYDPKSTVIDMTAHFISPIAERGMGSLRDAGIIRKKTTTDLEEIRPRGRPTIVDMTLFTF